MGLYVEELSVPAGTPENSPVTKKIRLEPGVLKKIEVLFPFGCNCLVKVKIKRGGKVIVPANADMWLVGNGETVSIELLLEELAEPFELELVACSPNTQYDHTIYFRFHIVPPEIAFPEKRIEKFLQEIAKRLIARRIE